jgi:RNA polymerase sigma factor (sigma-70 family)
MPRLFDERDTTAALFERFVRDSAPRLAGFLARLRVHEDDVPDIAQESVARLLRYRDSEPAAAWPALLYRIAINVARDRARHERHATPASIETDSLAADDSPEQHASDQEALSRARAAILKLPSRCRVVYLMHRIDGLSYPEIARRCGISIKAVEKHMSRALRELRDARERPGAGPT